MKKTALLLLLIIGITACQKERCVNPELSLHYFYSEKDNRILYSSQNIVESFFSSSNNYRTLAANADSFEVVHNDFGKDKDKAFYTYIALSNVDAASFKWSSEADLPVDKNHVYRSETDTDTLSVIPYADPETYQKVKLDVDCIDQWYTDKRHYYFLHKKNIYADKRTLKFESPYFPHDRWYIFYLENDSAVYRYYYKGKVTTVNKHIVHDQRYVFYTPGCTQCLLSEESDVRLDSTQAEYRCHNHFRVEMKNPNSFINYNHNHYFGIDGSVYFMGRIIPEAKAETFHPLGGMYGKDNKAVYYANEAVTEASLTSFKMLPNKAYAKDTHAVFKNGKLLKGYQPDKFESDQWGQYPDNFNFGRPPSAKKEE